jgi:hypothetical protein
MYPGKRRKMFSTENIFRKNDFLENIFQRKPFYVEVNGALINGHFIERTTFFFFFFYKEDNSFPLLLCVGVF